MVGEFGDLKQVGDQLAHHLSGVVFIIVGKGEFFIMIEQIPAHIPLDPGPHEMALVGHIVFAEGLDQIKDQKACKEEGEGAQDGFLAPGEPVAGRSS